MAPRGREVAFEVETARAARCDGRMARGERSEVKEHVVEWREVICREVERALARRDVERALARRDVERRGRVRAVDRFVGVVELETSSCSVERAALALLVQFDAAPLGRGLVELACAPSLGRTSLQRAVRGPRRDRHAPASRRGARASESARPGESTTTTWLAVLAQAIEGGIEPATAWPFLRRPQFSQSK